jgi:hypothetical protein
MENLQGDRTVVPEIAREVDGGHTAAPEFLLEHVSVGQTSLEVVDGSGQY